MPLKIIRQDITRIECDAIVNPTNRQMMPTGGTDASVHSAAGNKLLKMCRKLGGCDVGKAKITFGFGLPCRYVIHTAGPQWIDGNHGEKGLLESCYTECLKLAASKRCKTVAFPLISSGTNGFPKDRVLKIALETISEFLFENEMTVFIVVYDKKSYEISKSLFDDVKSFVDDTCGSYNPICKRVAEYVRATPAAEDHCSDKVSEASAFSVLQSAESGGMTACKRNEHTSQPGSKSLADMLKEMDKSFSELLFYYIDLKGISDVQCYKKANVDKKTFSKIKCKKNYKPSKQTVLSFAIALELNLEETARLLRTVGMSLSDSNKFDVIVKYFIINGRYNIFEINETLFEFDQVLLGSV